MTHKISIRMTDTFKTRDCRSTIPISFLKDLNLDTIACGFYGSQNEQNWMCELCTFSQIQSHNKDCILMKCF